MLDNKSIGFRLKSERESKKLTQDDIAKELGLNKSTIQRYESGAVDKIKIPILEAIAKILNVTPAWLIGTDENKIPLPSGAFPYHPTHKIPILGYISAGLPLYAEQHIEGYTYTDLNGGAEYFGLIVKGDSMNAARIYPGDTLIVRRQESVENGEIAVVMVNDENATVKHFKQKGDVVVLTPQSTNPINQPQIYNLKNTNIKIIGKVVRVEYSLE